MMIRGRAACRSNFSAQLIYVRGYGVVIAVVIVAPDFLKNPWSRENHVGPSREKAEQIELLLGQINRTSVEDDFPCNHIDRDRSNAQGLLEVAWADLHIDAAPKKRPHASREFDCRNRMFEIFVGAGLKAKDAIGKRAWSIDEDNRHLIGLREALRSRR
jgi:hypothetical protein